MVSREGDLERKWYMVGLEEMLISGNIKPDIMSPENGDPLPTHAHTLAMSSPMAAPGKKQLSEMVISFLGEVSHPLFYIMT